LFKRLCESIEVLDGMDNYDDTKLHVAPLRGLDLIAKLAPKPGQVPSSVYDLYVVRVHSIGNTPLS
jgi:hypothetical protein